ncbi:MAG: hypothetical protein WD512_10435 [Candidatus Paceibacterota bacterium]
MSDSRLVEQMLRDHAANSRIAAYTENFGGVYSPETTTRAKWFLEQQPCGLYQVCRAGQGSRQSWVVMPDQIKASTVRLLIQIRNYEEPAISEDQKKDLSELATFLRCSTTINFLARTPITTDETADRVAKLEERVLYLENLIQKLFSENKGI